MCNLGVFMTFVEWLERYKGKNNVYGDFANDCFRHPETKRGNHKTVNEVSSQLYGYGVCQQAKESFKYLVKRYYKYCDDHGLDRQ